MRMSSHAPLGRSLFREVCPSCAGQSSVQVRVSVFSELPWETSSHCSFCGVVSPVSVFCGLTFLLVLLLFTFVGFTGVPLVCDGALCCCGERQALVLDVGSPGLACSRVGSQVHILGM